MIFLLSLFLGSVSLLMMMFYFLNVNFRRAMYALRLFGFVLIICVITSGCAKRKNHPVICIEPKLQTGIVSVQGVDEPQIVTCMSGKFVFKFGAKRLVEMLKSCPGEDNEIERLLIFIENTDNPVTELDMKYFNEANRAFKWSVARIMSTGCFGLEIEDGLVINCIKVERYKYGAENMHREGYYFRLLSGKLIFDYITLIT